MHVNMKGIKFCADIAKTQVPFTPLEIGETHFVAVLVDTGSTGNLIFTNAYNELKAMFSPTDKKASMFGVEGQETIVDIVSAEFFVCGEKTTDGVSNSQCHRSIKGRHPLY